MRDTFAESMTIASLEGSYMTEQRLNIYTACEDLNFHWDMREVKEFRRLWKEGYHIADIAEYFDRPQNEVFILALDQAEKGKISHRQGGIYGERRNSNS